MTMKREYVYLSIGFHGRMRIVSSSEWEILCVRDAFEVKARKNKQKYLDIMFYIFILSDMTYRNIVKW